MLKKLSVFSVMAFAIATIAPAQAADMPVKAPMLSPVPVAQWSWTGFYVGINGGAGWGTTNSSIDLAQFGVPGTLPIASHNENGFIFGGQLGYNYQMGQFVVGVEGDFDWADIKGDAPCLVVLTCSAKVRWTADAAARLGIVVDRALIYVKGGAAWADTEYSANLNLLGLSVSSTASKVRVGAMFGAGLEYAVMRNWSAKLEYNYIDFGKDTIGMPFTVGPISATVNTDIDQQVHLIKAGLNYRF